MFNKQHTAEDIRVFLSSRYGIDVTDQEVKDTILQGLGGGNDVLDLMEVMACLLIPTFLKAFYQINGMPLPTHVVPTQDELLPLALKVILHDVSVLVCWWLMILQWILPPQLRHCLVLYLGR